MDVVWRRICTFISKFFRKNYYSKSFELKPISLVLYFYWEQNNKEHNGQNVKFGRLQNSPIDQSAIITKIKFKLEPKLEKNGNDKQENCL